MARLYNVETGTYQEIPGSKPSTTPPSPGYVEEKPTQQSPEPGMGTRVSGESTYNTPTPSTSSQTTGKPSGGILTVTTADGRTIELGVSKGLVESPQFKQYLQEQTQVGSAVATGREAAESGQKNVPVMLTPQEQVNLQTKANQPSTVLGYALLNPLGTLVKNIAYTVAYSTGNKQVVNALIKQEEYNRMQFVQNIEQKGAVAGIGEAVLKGGFEYVLTTAPIAAVFRSLGTVGKILETGGGVVLTGYGTTQVIEGAKEYQTGQVTYQASGLEKIIWGGLGIFAGSALIYSGYKAPVKWGEIKWELPLESKGAMLRNVNMEQGTADVISKSSTILKGSQEAYWGLARREVFMRGSSETAYTIDITKNKIINPPDYYVVSNNAGIARVYLAGRLIKTDYLAPPPSLSQPLFFSRGSELIPKEGAGKINMIDFSNTVNRMGEVIRSTGVRDTTFSLVFSEPKLLKTDTTEIKPPDFRQEGNVFYPSFKEPKELLVKSLYRTESTIYNVKTTAGGYSIAPFKNPIQSLDLTAVVSKEPIIFTSSGGSKGGISFQTPTDTMSVGSGGSSFDFIRTNLGKKLENQFKNVAESGNPIFITTTTKQTTGETTYVRYPGQEFEITQLTGLETRTGLVNQLRQQTGQETSTQTQTQTQQGLQNQLEQQLQQQLQLQLRLQQQLQLNLGFNLEMGQDIILVPPIQTGQVFLVKKTKGGEDRLEIIKLKSLLKPTASLYSLERAFSEFKRGSLARGSNIEQIYREMAGSSGLSLEFPAAEFIKRGKKK